MIENRLSLARSAYIDLPEYILVHKDIFYFSDG